MRRKAFTITELLVVIMIVSIVASIVFPVFTQAKAKAKAAVCISNIRQIYTALSLYENAEGEYPPNTLNWPGLKPYYPTQLTCPVAPAITVHGFDYLIFDFIAPSQTDPMQEKLYEAWDACRKLRGTALPIIFDNNHDSNQEAYATGDRFVLLGRLDGSVARIDSKMANDRRIAKDLPCPNAPFLFMNF